MKNNDMKRIIVGIDHGYKNMKTANTMFPTAISKNDAPKNKYEEVMKEVLIRYTQMVYRKLKESRINTDLIPVIFVGGGAVVMKRFGTYDEDNTEFITDLSANAKGYEKVYRLLME